MFRHRFATLLVWAACLAVSAEVRAQPSSGDAGTLVPPAVRPEFRGHPPYPDASDGRTARVVLRVVIDEEGEVAEASVISMDRESDPAYQFQQLALDFVRTVEFTPATVDGKPIRAAIRFEVVFEPPRL